MKKFIGIIAIAIALSLAPAESNAFDIYVKIAPPTKKVVVVKHNEPFRNAVWIDGYWAWTGRTYIWKDGYWAKPKRNHIWVAGSWESTRNGWKWREGRWDRRASVGRDATRRGR